MNLDLQTQSRAPEQKAEQDLRNVYADPLLTFLYWIIDSETTNSFEGIIAKMPEGTSKGYVLEMLNGLEDQGYITFENNLYFAIKRGHSFKIDANNKNNVFPKINQGLCHRVLTDVENKTHKEKGESFNYYCLPDHPELKARCAKVIANLHNDMQEILKDALNYKANELRVIAITNALPEAEDFL